MSYARGNTWLNGLSIVFPMYNERDNIETAVLEALRVGPLITQDLEIVVVDDASTDGSGALLDRLAGEHPQVFPIHHPVNRKLGGALKTGFGAASKEWILYMDSDLPICMDDALAALPLTKDADVVIGWRKSRAESRWRTFLSWVYNRLVRLVFGLQVRDVNFAFKLFRRSLYERARLTSEGSFIDAELLLEIRRQKATIAEIGMNYYPRVAGESKLAGFDIILRIVFEMFRYRVKRYEEGPENFGCKRRRFRFERANQPWH
jgi:glycosyltransferase involved in cell wall biosynthesis